MMSTASHQTDRTATTPIRVMIVEDSRTISQHLASIISGDPRLQVAAAVYSGEEALRRLHHVRPDVICLDIRLPGINGFEVVHQVMSHQPTPIVVCSAAVEHEELKISMNALRAGALAVVEKPVGATHEDYQALADRLCTQLVVMSQVRLVRQRPSFQPRLPGVSAARPPNAAGMPVPHHAAVDRVRAVGIVASTGGPAALACLLRELPAGFPAPILLVQHMTPSFYAGFLRWLGEQTPLRLGVAEAGCPPEPGHIYAAPSDQHLQLRRGRLWPSDAPPVCGHRPSGTVLLRSMAECYGPAALGVILTGMGRDGAEGIAAIRRAGGHTIAEDASTAVVYGMPGAAAEIGGVCESLPIHQIASRLMSLADACAEVSPWTH